MSERIEKERERDRADECIIISKKRRVPVCVCVKVRDMLSMSFFLEYEINGRWNG